MKCIFVYISCTQTFIVKEMVMMPPSMSLFNEIKTAARQCYAQTLADTKLSPMQKSKALIDRVEFIQNVNNIYGPCVRNIFDALNERHEPEDCVESGKGVKYLPLDAVMRRLEEAFVLDKELIRRAWMAVQEETLRQLALFGEAAKPLETHEDDDDVIVVSVKRGRF